ncbi:MAG: hypothetical protein AABW86_06245 [Candidatus Micrarchaeota archaeon]
MIIQIDHIAFSSMNFAEHIRILQSLGYLLKFSSTGKKNMEIKRSLLREFGESHDLALLTHVSSIPIELLNHGHVNTSEGYIFPLFDNAPDEFLKSIGVGAGVSSYNGSFRFNKFVVKTSDVRKSADFWKNFGFREISCGSEAALLEFRSPLSKVSCTIFLKHDTAVENQKYFLDDMGFNCIAFISNSAKKEREALIKNGIKTTEIEQFTSNNTPLNVFFAIGPAGEVVEIIEPQKVKK